MNISCYRRIAWQMAAKKYLGMWNVDISIEVIG